MGLCAIALAGGANAADKKPLNADEMKSLLANGLSVSSSDMRGGQNFTGQVTYAANGTLSGTLTFKGKEPIPLSGTWKLDGAKLCRTINPLQPQEVCESWLRNGDKEVVHQVGTAEVGISRWQ
jgi:hypothetical protein